MLTVYFFHDGFSVRGHPSNLASRDVFEHMAPHHRDRQVSPLGIGGEMRFVEDVASVAGLVPTGAGCRHPRVQGPLFGSSRRFRRYPAVKRPKSSTQLGDEHADRQMV